MLLGTHPFTRLTAPCPGLPRWAGTRKVKPIWILLEQKTVSGSGISWAICVSTSLQTDNHDSTPLLSFYRPDALPAAQPTASKHWRVNALKHTKLKILTAIAGETGEDMQLIGTLSASVSDDVNTSETSTATLVLSLAESRAMSCKQQTLAHANNNSTLNRWRTVVRGTWKDDDSRLNMSHEGAARVWHLQLREVLFPCPTNYCVSHVLSYDQPLA